MEGKISLILMGLILMGLTMLLLLFQIFLSKKFALEESAMKPLESGFESLFSSNSYSSTFLFLAILFVFFDLEVILLFPGICSFISSFIEMILWGMVLLTILITLLMEWAWYGLKWLI